ncbi:hypothetical protein CYY_006894 [Polysphondylium violaceum]|uniref:DUF1682 family protein n=1 Tax=Polysphondylium violaceum TaxID=133409 RepID=A0A8J4PPJ3_9MYCE|nr:hypothetical protein CYY_006894 [Polysphondylium violaceum]
MNKKIYFILIGILLLGLISVSLSQPTEFNEVEVEEDIEYEGTGVENKYQSLNQDGGSEAPQPQEPEIIATEVREETEEMKKKRELDALPFFKRQKHWYMEITFIVIIIFYVINYFIGEKTNRDLVKLWGRKFQPIFEQNFAKVGNRDVFTIIKINASTFTFICTGRENCNGAQVTLDLKKRHDLFSVLLDAFGFGSPDKVTIEVALTKDVMDPLIFAVVKQKALAKFKSDHEDVNLFCSKYNQATGLSSSFGVLCDTDCLPSLFLKNEVVSTLNANENLFESMYFTDHSLINTKYQKALQFIFKFPKVSDIDKLVLLTKMAVHFIDIVAKVELPKAHKQKAEKLREKAKESVVKQAHQDRQEELQKKKFEKMQKEKEMVAKMTPEQQRKYDEKEYKKQLKKKASGKYKVLLS